MKLTKKLEAEVLKVYKAYWDAYLSGDFKTFASMLDDNITVFGTASSEVFTDKKETVRFYKATAGQLVGKAQFRNRKINLNQVDTNILVNEQCDLYLLMDRKWIFYGHVRVSAILKQTKTGWKLIHQHASFPDIRAEEGEQVAMEKIQAENLLLRDAVKRRTIELEEKNSELEIESALEKVRTVAMAMKTPDDMLKVCSVINQQLKQLGTRDIRNIQTAIFNTSDNSYLNYEYFPVKDKSIITRIDYRLQPDVRAFAKKMMKAPGTFYTKSFKGAELKKWNQYQEKTNQFIDPGQYKASGLHYYFYSIGMGALGISVFTPLSKEEIVIFKRFHNVFELAYKRFVDIQKAEAQTREAQIEVAVERVRAKALAMHKSEDVYDVLRMLRNALFGLNLQGITGVTICLKEDSENVRLCDITDIDQNGRYGWDITFKINEIDPRLWVSQIWRSKKEIIAFEQDSDDLKRALKWLGQYDKKMADQITELIKVNKIKHGWHRAVRLANGMLITDFTNKPPAETEPILLKMGAAFDLAYKRFLDLKNAEAQAREAQIEAALEKIRSRSLAMHHSRELKEVIAVLFEKLNELNVLLGTVAIQLFDHASMNSFLWVGNAIQDPQMVNMPYDKKMMLENTYVKDGWEAMREGRDIINKEYSLKEKNKFFKYAFANNDLTQIPESAREVLRKIKKHIVCLFTEKNSALFVDSFDGQHFSKENLAIIKRAGKVFEQCYIRFLDLQKAEAQAREGQIQLALERVRARTMAMHHSDELADVVKLLYQEFDKLKINNESTDIEIGLIDEETGIASIWAHFYLSDGTISTFQFPTTHFDEVREEVEKWKTVPLKKRNELFFTTEFSQERLKKFMEIADQLPGLAEIFRPLIEAKITKWVTHNAYFSHGFLTLQGTEAYSPETQEIQKRFAKVFEQTYTRFLDLKKAEAQAREAQIEASLERVRAKTIAMHKSSDQLGVVKVLGEQLELLGVKFDSVNFNTDYLEKDWNLWLYNSGVPMYPDKLHIPYLDHPCFNRPIEAYKEGADLQSFVFTKEEKDSLFDHIYTYSIARMAPEERKRYTYAAPGLVWSVAYGKHTAVTISNYRAEPFSDEENAILKRFANVFEQSYTRFLDLQKAEAQAREAEIELALERVRARTMAMQKPTEFNEVINVIGEQFLHLGFDLQWATFSAKGLDIANGLDLWIFAVIPGLFRSADRLFIPRAHHPIFTAYEQALNDYQTTGKDFFVMTFDKTDKDSWLDHLHKTTTYKDLPPELLALDYDKPGYTNSVVILKDTWLSIGKHDSVPFKDEENAILKRFSVAFGQAYTRFLDLQKAEAQAREAEIELALERVRARTMAMQKSDELRETVLVIYEQLKLLHFDSRACNIIIIDKESGSARYWVSGFSQEIFPVSYMVPYLNHPYHDALLKPWKQGDKYVVYEYTGKLKQSFDKIFFTQTEFRNIPDEAKNVMTGLKSVILSTAYTTYGAIQSLGTEPLSDENASVLQRFAKVFEQTYTRFLDLQKAEAQAREAQVEVALERVRSKAMAMHKTEDLPSAVSLLFDELDKLEPGMLRCGIGILHREKRTADVWTTARSETGTNIQTSGDEPMDIHPLLQGDFDAWLRQEEFSYTLEGKDLENYYQVLTETNFQLPESASFDTIKKDHKQYYYVTPFELGTIFAFREEEFTTEARMVMKRFANVFNLTYKRFLDLQKAESQAREAQIEAALERVRSRTMGMQKSEELKEVIRVVYEQFVQLNIHVEHAGFIIDYKQRDDMHIWLADQHEVPFQVTIPYFDCAHWNSFIDAKQKGKDFFANHLGFEEKNKFYKALFDLFPVPDEAKEYYFNCPGLAISTVLLENVGLYIENFSGIPYTDEENNILMRFGKVFQQTYTRFLDLQKAEAQAREAKIETALEKVRARTMGMQRSGELPQAASLLFQQIQSLGMPTWSAGYCLWDDDKNAITLWMSSEGVIQPALRMPLTEDPSLMHFREAYERGESFWVEAVGGEELKSHYAYLRTLPGLKETLDDIETAGFPVPTFQIFHLAYFSKGFLLFITYEPVPEAHDIFKRFANVFEQTYTRFLDLQKAEAQAKEAQIELGLERVRARAMAMQNSDELKELIGTVFIELTKLDLVLTRCLIMIFDPETKGSTWWMANSEAPSDPTALYIKYHELPPYLAYIRSWRERKLKWQYILEGSDKKGWDDFIFVETELSHLPDFVIAGMKAPERVYLSASFNNFGCLNLASLDPLSNEHFDILLRFAKVFDLTYTRFNDLQRAEAQAREARIEAALERVRSRAMAMHKTDELLDAAELIYKELTALGITSMNISYAFVDEEEKYGSYYSVSLDGKANQFPFVFPHTETKVMRSLLSNWRKQVPFDVTELDEEATLKHQTYIAEHIQKQFAENSPGIPFSVEAFLEASPKKAVIYNFNFAQGYIFIIGSTRLTTEQEQMVLRFTKVFELTYRRFLDLKQAEAQAREAQIELALERVRARTMAMHHSDELAETAQVLFHQLQELGGIPDRIAIGVVDEDAGVVNYWSTDQSGSHIDKKLQARLNERTVLSKTYQAWKDQKKSLVVDLHGEDVKEWIKFAREEIGVVVKDEFIKDRRVHNFAFFSQGWILVTSHEPQTAETIQILERFASVFNLTYRRFLDLEKAEAQANEARIEISLERIRARALAMHKSDELIEVAKVLWEQMALLGQPELEASVVHLYEYDPDHIISSRAVSIGTDSSAKLTYGQMAIPKNSCEVVREWLEKFYSDSKEYTIELSGAKQKEWYDVMGKLAPDVVNSMRQKGSLSEKRFYRFSKFSGGALLMVSTQEPSLEVAYLQKRAAAVFDLAYRRFSDLQKTEAQARESEIELALERVRAKSMSMRRSDELADLVRTLFKELNSIGFSINGCIIMTYDERTNDSTWWIANSDGVSNPVGLLVPNHPHAPYQAYLKEWKKQTPKWSYRLGGAEKKEWDQYVFTNSGLAALPDPVKAGMQSVEDVQLNVCFNKYASITFGSLEPMGDKDFDTLHRFAKVFEQSYTRFLDLQNAEAQAREAKIEAALERVRAKAMAMHKSEDLHEAVKIMFEEFQKLNLDVLRCGVGILNKNSRTGSVWATSVSDDGLAVQISADESFETHPLMMLIYEYWQKQEDLEYILQGQDLMNYYRAMKESDLKLPESQLTFSEDELQPQYYYGAMFRSGGLYAFREKPFAEEDKKIMKRFASVVNLTYNRFLDLQKAEASAREAQIEAGLERVRATTMAMHNSDDVSAATATMFAELEKLGIQNLRGGITIIKQDQTQEVWSITNLPDGSTIRSIGVFDMRLHPFWQAIFEAKERKEDYMYYWMAGKDKENYIAILNATPNYLDQPIKEIPDVHVQCYFFGEGGVWTNSLQPHSEEDKQIMKRFASVFSLTFRRYQDLKKAEAQAREATIEAALEKVRGKAMAMHNSNDLSVTTSIIISELKKLGIKPIRCGVGIINKETHKAQLYTARFSPDGDSLSVVGWVLLKGHPVLETIYEKWVHGEDYYPELSGDSRKAYYERLLAGLSIPIPDFRDDEIHYGHFFSFSVGCLYAWSEVKYNDDEIKILKRFASIIDLTFRRYFELQKSEANAREAVKQAALDRVRADIASMRTVSDLDRITPLIWKELTILGVPFIRCGVFIMDETQKLIHTFLSTPEGKAIAAFHLPYDTPGNISKVVDNWRRKTIYVDHWGEEEFIQFADILMKEGTLTSREQYLKTIPHGGFYLHFLPFLQGMLYVGNIEQLNEEHIELIQHVAGAFSTAYARYEDFNRLEVAKQQVENTLTDLKQAQQQLVQSEKMASLGELTAGIAHEIQNPLNFVNNFSDVSNELLDEMKNELEKGNKEDAIAIVDDVKQNLEKILHHGKRADAIVKGMLQHSRTSSGQKEPTDINVLADEYLRLAYHGLRAKDKSFNAKFETDFDNSIGKVNIIPQDIGRVILNLINNAFYAVTEKRKHVSDGPAQEGRPGEQVRRGYEPTVTVTTLKDNGRIEIKVKDNGNGIPQRVLDKIFQPFFTTKPTGQGTGLGLSLAYDIVTKGHGGDLKVITQEGEGSEFIIQLPAN